MKDIKFRAWDRITQDMTYKIERDGASPYDFEDLISDTERFEIMQFTGLLDKKGNEIFEGDIVSLWHEEMFFQGTVKGSVEWDNCSGCFQIMFDSSSMPFVGLDLDYCECEVIGNIYENPELLISKP